MNKQEFEALAKMQVTDVAYAKIERIYMSAPFIEKDQFCREFRIFKLGESETVQEMAEANEQLTIRTQNLTHDIEMKDETIKELKADIDNLRDQRNHAEAALHTAKEQRIELALALVNNGLDAQAIEIIGHEEVIGIKASMNLPLSEIDRVFLVNKFCNR